MSGPNKFWKKHKTTILICLILGAVIGGGYWFFTSLSPQAETKEEETPLTKLVSTFELYSSVDGEDVSSFQEITIWVPKDSAEFDDDEDQYRLSTNFEKEVTSKDADDVSIDLRDYEYVWLEIEDNSVFANTYRKLYPGGNYDYKYPVYDLSSDVNFNMFVRDTLAAVTVSGYQTDGNFTIIMDVDHEVKTNCHYGDDWATSTEDFNDMTLSEKKEIWDEARYQCQAPLYDPTIDEEKEYDDALEQLTDALTLRMQFNTTVSTVDGNAAQVNMTINDSSEPIEIIISGEYVYLLFYEVIDFKESAYSFDLEMNFAANITLSDIDSGRVVVPRDDENLGAFTKYSDIGT
ncbi:MAG: hypothetical protein ACFFDH_13795 [Promethearchaeota archaeon]